MESGRASGVYVSIRAFVVITLEGFSSTDVERNPELDLWISGHPQTERTIEAKRLEAQRVKVPVRQKERGGGGGGGGSAEEAEEEREVQMPPRSAEMPLEMQGELVSTNLPRDTYLELDLWLYARNSGNVWCRMSAGSAHVSLSEILVASARGSHTHVVDVDIPKARNLHKATVYIRIEQRAAFISAPVQFSAEPSAYGRSAIDTYLERCGDVLPGDVQLYARNVVIANTKLSHWQTRAGLLPPEMYWVDPLMSGQQRPSLKIYTAMMRYVLEVNEWDEQQLLYVAKMQLSAEARGVGRTYNYEFTRVCVVLAEMLSFYSNCCPYVGDFVHPGLRGPGSWDPKKKVMIESFDDLFRRLSGDCEDLARATGLMMLWLRSYTGETSEERHGLLHYLVETLEIYVDMGTLGNVTSAALGQRENENDWGAHMFGVFVSASSFVEMTTRGSDPATVQMISSVTKLQVGAWAREMPVLVLEGTGRMSPILRPPLDYFPRDRGEAQRRVARERAMHSLRSNMSAQTFMALSSYMEQTRTESYNVGDAAKGKHLYRFYRTFNQGYTAYFFRRRVMHGRFVFLDLSEGDKLVYSARVEDVLYKTRNVSIRFTQQMDRACYEQSMHLIRWHLNPIPVPIFSERLARLACNLRELKSLNFSDEGTMSRLTRENIASNVVYLNTFVNPIELTPEYLRHLAKDIQNSGRTAGIVGVSCVPMPIARNVGTVCIRFHCVV